jgi:hypothetical protein
MKIVAGTFVYPAQGGWQALVIHDDGARWWSPVVATREEAQELLDRYLEESGAWK